MALRQKWENHLTEQWTTSGEALLWVHIGQQAYAASVINGQPHVPHAPLGEVPQTTLEAPFWPLPSEAVTTGRFMGDEWADDPSIGWWATAARSDQDAVRFADHLAAGYDHTLLVASSTRLALVVESGILTEPDTAPEPVTEGKGWFGKARQAVAQAQSAAEGLSNKFSNHNSATSFHEIGVQRVRQMQTLHFGRSIPRKHFLRIDFIDDSYLLIRSGSMNNEETIFNDALGRNQQGKP
ncbi:hypothetical protein [Halosaccharopolyspora lacisalsi]|nr:hypothetical protein [Halosaccharopolyspora lacisalsi]